MTEEMLGVAVAAAKARELVERACALYWEHVRALVGKEKAADKGDAIQEKLYFSAIRPRLECARSDLGAVRDVLACLPGYEWAISEDGLLEEARKEFARWGGKR